MRRIFASIILGIGLSYGLPKEAIHEVSERAGTHHLFADSIDSTIAAAERVEMGSSDLFSTGDEVLRDLALSLQYTLPLGDARRKAEEITASLNAQGEISDADVADLREILFNEDGTIKAELIRNGRINVTSTAYTAVVSLNNALSPLTSLVSPDAETAAGRGLYRVGRAFSGWTAGFTEAGRAAQRAEQEAKRRGEDAERALIAYQNSLLEYVTILTRLQRVERELEEKFRAYHSAFYASLQKANAREVSNYYTRLANLLREQQELPPINQVLTSLGDDYSSSITLFQDLQAKINQLRNLILKRVKDLAVNEELDPQINALVAEIEENMQVIGGLLDVTINNSLLEDAGFDTLSTSIRRLDATPPLILGSAIAFYILFPTVARRRRRR